MKALHGNFLKLQEAAAEKAKQGGNAMKAQLKELGVEKKTLDALPQVLAKKKKSQQDKKMLAGVEEKLTAGLRSRTIVLGTSTEEVKKAEQAVNGKAFEATTRDKELAGFDVVMKAREAERRGSEEDVQNASHELEEHETRMSKEGLMRFNSSAQQCAVCCEDLALEKAVSLGCGHGWYCLDCMTRFVESRLDDGIAGDIPCPQCSQTVAESDLVILLPKKTIFRLHARSIEKEAVAGGDTLRSCPTPNCPMRQTIKEGASGKIFCPMCQIEGCWLCGTSPFHEGQTCEQYARRQRKRGLNKDDESFYQWMEETGTRQCPKCQMATSKENLERQTEQRSECHKMICRNCGTKFCFKCLALLTDTYSCGCTKSKHGFIDPHSGELVKHRPRGKAKAEPKAVPNSGGG
jgi:hypothetical protein